MSACQIKAVTFDLWETLLFERDGDSSRRTAVRCRSLERALSKFGVDISVEQLEQRLNNMTSLLVNIWDKNRDVTHLDQLRLIMKHASDSTILLKDEWVGELSKAYTSPLFEVPPLLNPNARTALQWLKRQDKKVGLVCNTGLTPGTALRKFLDEQEVAEHFDLMVFSDEVGIRKPDPKIFKRVAQELNVKPFETVHIGDNLKSDVWGAKNAGFKAIHFSSSTGRDRLAESDPASLVSQSRNLGTLSKEQIAPDKTIKSLLSIRKAIEELEANEH